MPRTNRNFFQRIVSGALPLSILLLCFFSMGARAAAGGVEANPYEAPARDFARRVAASFPAATRVAVDVRNRSMLASSDVAVVRTAFLGELAERGLSVATSVADSADAQVSATITLSENTGGFLWIAEIRQGDRSAVMLMAVPRVAAAPPAELPGITLRSTLVWSGPEDVLASAAPLSTTLLSTVPAASVAASTSVAAGAPNILLLVTDGVTATVTDAQHTFKIDLPPTANVARDAQGALTWSGNTLIAIVNGEACALAAPLGASQPQCRADESPHPAPAPTAQFGSQRADLPPACGEASGEIVAAGAGDYTQPDSIRVYEMRDGAAAPVSPALDFPGPVMSLHVATALQAEAGPAALAVIRNLATGDDEVYEISLVCGR
jgi:hypothetical protein